VDTQQRSVVGIDQGTAHDRQVLYELFKGFIELSQATGSTVGVAKAQQYLSKIEPPNIGTTVTSLSGRRVHGK